MKHQPYVIANALAVTTAVIYVVCALVVALLPDLSMAVARSWFHGVDLAKISSFNITFGSFLLGIVTATAGAWLIGFVFAKTYNQFRILIY